MKISHIFFIILTPISLVTVQCNALFKEVGQAVEATTETATDVARDTVQTAGDVAQDVIETPERVAKQIDPYEPLFDTPENNQLDPLDKTYPLTKGQLQKVEAADAVRKTIIPKARRATTPYLGTAQRRVRKNVEQNTAQETIQAPQEKDTYIEAEQRVPYFQTARARYREETKLRRAAKKRYRQGGWRKDIDANEYNWEGPVTRDPHNARNSD